MRTKFSAMPMRGIPRMGLAGAGLVLLLTGCTSYVTTNVTAFQNWSASDTDRSYTFLRTAQHSDLEESSYEYMVDNALSAYGFQLVEASRAHYGVALAYGVRNDTTVVPQPVFYDTWQGPVWYGGYGGFRGYGYGGFGPPPFGVMGPVAYVNQAYPSFVKGLSIQIVDQKTHAEVYKVNASTTGPDPELLLAMPYLVRSALNNFPMPNGTVIHVSLPVGANGPAPAANTNLSANEAAAAPATMPASSAVAPK
ncbi:DUF4136 domain-containing protein [Burkholderia sp. L27(2015)]|uniref:DUF4136 domain-containing protein n=1 Tax=Burkholderia sp. L27(2015) TaxID=1641858 RepID=UPI0020B10ED0|nr:DUF4136 domain-containing protein [Burkholderia sp. L27(2015)]